jgi:hypothetical protein
MRAYGGKGQPFKYSHTKGAKKTPGTQLYGKKGRGAIHYMTRRKGTMAVSQRQIAHRTFVSQFFANNPLRTPRAPKGQGQARQAEAKARMAAAGRAWTAAAGRSVPAARQIVR